MSSGQKSGKLKLHWTTAKSDLAGNALGYATHNSCMRQYCEPLFDFDEDADTKLQIVPADNYRHYPDKYNVLFTMWEASDVPPGYVAGLNLADLIIVPSRFCKELFRKYTDKPIEICAEGVEPERYPFFQRELPKGDQRFRFLWCGAPNPRKGSISIEKLTVVFEKFSNIELYIKTTAQKYDHKAFIRKLWHSRHQIRKDIKEKKIPESRSIKNMLDRAKIRKSGKIEEKLNFCGRNENIIFDTRKLPFDDLVALYNSAHCFLLPTVGEGWGLTLCEAMATGCPSIATNVTGVSEFFNDEVGYPISYKPQEQYLGHYNVRASVFVPDTKDLFKQMMTVLQDYGTALKKGRKAHERIHNKFTWTKAAQRLHQIISKYRG